VAFVAIGATMVGSINFTKKKGDYVKKGDEVRNPASYSKLLFFQFSSLSLFLIGTCFALIDSLDILLLVEAL
jgi:phosphatidylserine decarboxylase